DNVLRARKRLKHRALTEQEKQYLAYEKDLKLRAEKILNQEETVNQFQQLDLDRLFSRNRKKPYKKDELIDIYVSYFPDVSKYVARNYGTDFLRQAIHDVYLSAQSGNFSITFSSKKKSPEELKERRIQIIDGLRTYDRIVSRYLYFFNEYSTTTKAERFELIKKYLAEGMAPEKTFPKEFDKLRNQGKDLDFAVYYIQYGRGRNPFEVLEDFRQYKPPSVNQLKRKRKEEKEEKREKGGRVETEGSEDEKMKVEEA